MASELTPLLCKQNRQTLKDAHALYSGMFQSDPMIGGVSSGFTIVCIYVCMYVCKYKNLRCKKSGFKYIIVLIKLFVQ